MSVITMDKKRLVIFDGNALIHRAYHALPPLTTPKGELVNAVYGFLLVFLRAIKEFKPEFVVVTFDFPAPSFRRQKYEPYKATRKKAPDDLYSQIPKTKEILSKLGAQVFEKQGYEADDIIATIARGVSQDKSLDSMETIIVSGDLDTLQLVDDKTKVYALRKGVKDIILYDEKMVQEKYGGLVPKQLADFKALRGDPSDNIPGVFGIGEKTAVTLIKEFNSIEELYSALDKDKLPENVNKKLKERLKEYKEKSFLSKDLAQLEYNVPIDFNLEKCRWGMPNKETITRSLGDYGFNSLINRFQDDDSLVSEEKEPKKKEELKKAKEVKSNLQLW